MPHEHEVSRSALHVKMCVAISEAAQDRLQKRKERLQAIRLQPDGHLLIHCICEEKSHQNDE